MSAMSGNGVADARIGAEAGRAGGGGTVVLRVGAAMVLSAAAASALLRVFGSDGLRLILFAVPAAGLSTGLLTGFVARRATWVTPLAWLIGLLAGALPGIALAASDPYGSPGLGSRLDSALTNGWQTLVSVPVPVPSTASFVSLPLIIVAAATALSVVMVLGSRPATALIPQTLVFGGALVLGVHGPGPGAWLAGAYAVAAVLFLAVTAGALAWRGVVTTAVGLAMVAGVAIASTATLHGTSPYDPRAALVPPLATSDYADPLSQLSAQTARPAAKVFTATLSGALLGHPRNWVVLAYDRYDGATWQAKTTARPAEVASTSPGTLGSGTAQVTLGASAQLLPHPVSVTADGPLGLDYDSAHELLLDSSSASQYTVTVSVSEPSASALTTAAIPPDAAPQLTAVPACMPAALRQLASKAQSAAGLPDEQAAALEQELRAKPYVYDMAAPPGEGCGNLERMLATGHGTSAQFATAFALGARSMGLPTRIVSGYLPGKLGGDTVVVSSSDAYSWPQVLFTGVGWVDFDPTPNTAVTSTTPPREQQSGLKQVLTNVASGNTTTVRKTVDKITKVTGHGHGAMYWIVLAALVLTVVPIGFVCWLVVARVRLMSRRRKRRDAADSRAGVLGAWDEVLDPLRYRGVVVLGRTAPQVAESIADLLPDRRAEALRLASVVELALYDRVDEREVAAAWQLSDSVRRALLASVGWRGRMRRALLLRPKPTAPEASAVALADDSAANADGRGVGDVAVEGVHVADREAVGTRR